MSITRRTLLGGLGLATAGMAACPTLVLAAAPKSTAGGKRFSSSRALMGTFVSMSVIHSSQTRAEEAMGRAFEEMDRLVAILNRHDPASALSVLNDQGKLSAPPELAEVLGHGLDMASLTGQAFNPAVTPLVELVRRSALEGRTPDQADLRQALELADLKGVALDGDTICLGKPGMALTLDGSAKGYVADQTSRVLLEQGMTSHLIDAGGDLVARGGREQGQPWRIAVRGPHSTVQKGEQQDVVELYNGALATSGSDQTLSPFGHHLVDPHTGRCPQALASVTVRADNLMRADGLATALFVTPPSAGWRLASSLAGCRALFLGADGAGQATPGFHGA